MPPKKQKRTAAPSTSTNKRASKLAKENDLSASEEAEIKEVFHLFSEPHDDFPDEKEGVIRVEDVRKALVALALPPSSPSEQAQIIDTLDPTSTGYVPYSAFLAVAAMKHHSRSDEAMAAEVDAAFALFTRGRSHSQSQGEEARITVQDLRRIARQLKEEGNAGEELLRDMILEANGGAGVNEGVTLEEFRGVMMRAGVF